MREENKHTLTPLSVKKNGRHFTLAAPSVSGMPGSYLDVGTIWDEQHAAFIIKAVNSHELLVKAAELLSLARRQDPTAFNVDELNLIDEADAMIEEGAK